MPIPGSHAEISAYRGQAKIVRHGDSMLIMARYLKVFIVATALGGALDDVCIVVVHPIRAQHLGHGRRRQNQTATGDTARAEVCTYRTEQQAEKSTWPCMSP